MNTRFIRDIIYRLKMDYGIKIDVYKIQSQNVNLETGIKNVIKTKVTINRAVLLPRLTTISFNTLKTDIAIDRRFAYLDQDEREILIDARDINFEIMTDNVLIYDHDRYEIREIYLLDHKQAWYLKVKHLKGLRANEIHQLNVQSTLTLVSNVSKI